MLSQPCDKLYRSQEKRRRRVCAAVFDSQAARAEARRT
jgi:hypothetical protein